MRSPRYRADPPGRRGDRGDPGRTVIASSSISGTFYSPPPLRAICPTDASCSIRGSSELRSRRSNAPRRQTRRRRRCTVSARCSRRVGRHPARGRHSNARLRCSRIWPKPTTTWARSSHSKAIFRRPSSAFALRSLDTGLPGCVEQSRLRVAAEREQRRSPRPLREGDRLATGFPRGPQQPWTALRARR